ncbi:hypothetical protein Tco_0605551 [Tanacetum coccineum]
MKAPFCIMKNPVSHSKTKYIEIRHHFIRDSYEKKLIQVIKIHTDQNVADLLTKAFDFSRLYINMDPHEFPHVYLVFSSVLTTKISQSSGSTNLVADETVHKELGDRMKRDVIAASKQSNDPPFLRVNILGSREDNMKLIEMMEHCTKLFELGEGSAILVESHHTPISAPSTSQPPTSPPSMQITHVAEEVATMPYDSPLLRVYSLRSDEGSMTLNELTVLCTTLSKKKLEHKVKTSKARRRVRLVVSEDEYELEDPSKQGRKIAQIDEDKGITLFISPEEDYIAEPDISTANVPVITAGAKKGKSYYEMLKPVQKKTKLQLEQKDLGWKKPEIARKQLMKKKGKG